MGKQPQPPASPSGTATGSGLPALFGSASGGILAYCGLLAAAVGAVITNSDFIRFDTLLKALAVLAIAAAMMGGFFSVLSGYQAVNLAIRGEKPGKENDARESRKRAAIFANIALICVIAASVLALLTAGAFAFRGAPAGSRAVAPITIIRISNEMAAAPSASESDGCRGCASGCPVRRRRCPHRHR